MSLVITGASGNLGRRTAELLLKTATADVVLITRSVDELSDLAARGAEVRYGDFAKPETLPVAFAGATRVLLISTSAHGPERIAQHTAAIEAAQAAGANLIAYTSIPNPDPDRNPAFVVPDHASTEAAILRSGVSYTFLRNAAYSEYVGMLSARNPLTDGAYVHNFGDGATAYVSRNDCAVAAAAVLAGGDEHANRAYDITGPEKLTGAQLAELYAHARGSAVEAVAVDDAAWIDSAVANGMPEGAAQAAVSFGRAIREGALNQISDDAERITGAKPASVADVLSGLEVSAGSR